MIDWINLEGACPLGVKLKGQRIREYSLRSVRESLESHDSFSCPEKDTAMYWVIAVNVQVVRGDNKPLEVGVELGCSPGFCCQESATKNVKHP
jgi:hypothetical protein